MIIFEFGKMVRKYFLVIFIVWFELCVYYIIINYNNVDIFLKYLKIMRDSIF